jgi:ribosome maturation protein SDO1
MVTKELSVTVPAQYAPKIHPLVKTYGKILKERWESDGSWNGTVEIPGGLEMEFYDKLNGMTHGHAQATLVTTKGETT